MITRALDGHGFWVRVRFDMQAVWLPTMDSAERVYSQIWWMSR